MTIVTPGIVPASILLQTPRPAWLDAWGRFAADLRFEDLPAEVVARAKLVILDCIGAIAAGAQEPEMRAFAERLQGQAKSLDGSPAIGSGRELPPNLAALANGTAGTMLELDEGNQFARGHPAIHVVPAALAAAQALGRSGRDLILAVVLGYEIGSRIGIASKLRVTMHPHGTWGTVGAAVAVAKLNGADAGEIVETINVSSSLGLTTSRRTMLEGGTVRNVYAGVSNQLGLMAWELVASGFVGERDGIGTVYDTVIADDFRPDEMVAELGSRYEIARNYFKRHAACRYTHGALDALAEIVARHDDLDPSAIERIEVDTYVWAAQLDSAEPRNMLAAKFSLPFALATAIVHGAATVPAFRQRALKDEAARELARKVVVREDSGMTARLPALRPARVAITLADGRVLTAEVLTNRGDTEDPYSPDEVRAKFHDLTDPVWGAAHAGRVAEAVDGLDGGDLAELIGLLAVRPSHAPGV